MASSSLSEFIRANLNPILSAWEQFAKAVPSASQINGAALRDHAAGMLLDIAADLECSQTPHEQAEKSKGHAPPSAQETQAQKHGGAPASAGFSVIDTVSEFRALRASVLQLWTAATLGQPLTSPNQLTRFNEAIDQALTESLARYSTDTRLFDLLLSSSPDLNYLFDVEGRYIYANKALLNVYGMTSSDAIVGKNFFDLDVAAAPQLQRELQQAIDTKMTYRGEMSCSGEAAIYEYLFVPIINDAGKVEAVAGTARDITERKASEEKLRKMANYDALTGLPNRSLFYDRLEQEVKRAKRTGLPMALLFIDLDGFKEVNDRLGHAGGDQLLQQAAQRISSHIRGTDTVARLGGDEFTVILSEIHKISHIAILAEDILRELGTPFLIMREEVQISGSIGITLFPQDAATSEDLVRNADQAMYVAKNAGRNRFSFLK